jgi:hypothetical protein
MVTPIRHHVRNSFFLLLSSFTKLFLGAKEGILGMEHPLFYMSQDPEVRARAVARDKFLWDLEGAKQAEGEEGRKEEKLN